MSLLKYPFSFKQLKNYYRTSTHAPVKGATTAAKRHKDMLSCVYSSEKEKYKA